MISLGLRACGARWRTQDRVSLLQGRDNCIVVTAGATRTAAATGGRPRERPLGTLAPQPPR